MSKKKSKKTKKHEIVKKKKSPKKTIIITACVVLVLALGIAGAIIADRLTNVKYLDFVGYTMYSQSAYNKDGKETDLKEIYNVRYDNYRGSLTFKEDSTFSLWMTVGPDDGTNDGTFTYSRGDDVIKGEYKSGKKIEFKIVRNKDGSLKRIEAPYEDYTIYFS